MKKIIIINFLFFSLYKICLSAEDVSPYLETRRISYHNHSITCLLPKDFKVNQTILRESIAHSKQFNEDIALTMKRQICWDLQADYWNAIDNKNTRRAIIYLHVVLQRSFLNIFKDGFDFYHNIIDIVPNFIKDLRNQSLTDQKTLEKISLVVRAHISFTPNTQPSSIPQIKVTLPVADVSPYLETRRISYHNHSITCLLPKDFKVNQTILKESIAHSKQFNEDVALTMKRQICWDLQADYWNAIDNKNTRRAIIYLHAVLQRSFLNIFKDGLDFYHNIIDIVPNFIKDSRNQHLTDREILENITLIVKNHIFHNHLKSHHS